MSRCWSRQLHRGDAQVEIGVDTVHRVWLRVLVGSPRPFFELFAQYQRSGSVPAEERLAREYRDVRRRGLRCPRTPRGRRPLRLWLLRWCLDPQAAVSPRPGLATDHTACSRRRVQHVLRPQRLFEMPDRLAVSKHVHHPRGCQFAIAQLFLQVAWLGALHEVLSQLCGVLIQPPPIHLLQRPAHLLMQADTTGG
jgi:hypothetical protein